MEWKHNPTTQVQVLAGVNLDSYILKRTRCGSLSHRFPFKKITSLHYQTNLAQIAHDLTKLVINFYYGAKDRNRKTHWRAWEKLELQQGGLGFRDFRVFKHALLTRQVGRLIIE